MSPNSSMYTLLHPHLCNCVTLNVSAAAYHIRSRSRLISLNTSIIQRTWCEGHPVYRVYKEKDKEYLLVQRNLYMIFMYMYMYMYMEEKSMSTCHFKSGKERYAIYVYLYVHVYDVYVYDVIAIGHMLLHNAEHAFEIFNTWRTHPNLMWP